MPRRFILPLLSVFAFGVPLMVWADCMGPYPPSMITAFNQNCAKDPSQQAFCSCIMDEVQKNIPLADFIEIGNSAGGINADPRFIKATQKCSPKLPSTPPAASTPPNAQSQTPPVNNGAGKFTPPAATR